ncbi:MAG: inositol monophosphatase family protein, partial [Anaerolineae bacterium]|nr:inositol monophosphatase family protein [Anaerolineae bacterium]
MRASGVGALTLPDLVELRDWLLELQAEIQRRVGRALQQQASEVLASVAREDSSDTIYELDRGLDEILLERCADLGERRPFLLIAEGGRHVFPTGADEADAAFRLIVDPLDGTRGIMYDKRSAWTLAAVAPNRGPATSLSDIVLAVQTEVPTSKQHLADALWAIQGRGARATRRDLLTGEERPFVPRPSRATDLSHGFAMLSKFFPGGKAVAAEIEEQLYARLESLVCADRVRVFDDQYISTGGQ